MLKTWRTKYKGTKVDYNAIQCPKCLHGINEHHNASNYKEDAVGKRLSGVCRPNWPSQILQGNDGFKRKSYKRVECTCDLTSCDIQINLNIHRDYINGQTYWYKDVQENANVSSVS